MTDTHGKTMNGWQYWSFEHETIAERLERLLKDADLTDTVNEKLVVKVHNFKRQLAGQIGRSLVIAELVRRNIVPTAFAGHVPDIDLLAHANDTTLQLQIKTYYKGSINFNAIHYLHIDFDGDRQIVCGPDYPIN